MILTITMNAAIDVSYKFDDFKINEVNRVFDVIKTPGGKGLNVTRVLKQLGNDVVASGMLGGALGEDIEKKLSEKQIENNFFKISGETRNCIAILHNGNQTEILEEGAIITEEEAKDFLEFFKKLVKENNIISISGSLPKGLPNDYYSTMIKICNENNKSVVLDCSGVTLLEVLKNEYKPKVIKPNTDELSWLIDKKINTKISINELIFDLKEVLKNDLFIGIEWIIVSLGADGSFAKHNDKFYKVNIPKIKVVNPVGSGDSTVAGIVSSLVNNSNDIELLKKANTLGVLNAMESTTGYVDLEKYNEIFEKIEVLEV